MNHKPYYYTENNVADLGQKILSQHALVKITEDVKMRVKDSLVEVVA